MPVYSSLRCSGCFGDVLYAKDARDGSPRVNKEEVKKAFPLYFEKRFRKKTDKPVDVVEPASLCWRCLKHLVKVGKQVEVALEQERLKAFVWEPRGKGI